jgi:hypothetical protein
MSKSFKGEAKAQARAAKRNANENANENDSHFRGKKDLVDANPNPVPRVPA